MASVGGLWTRTVQYGHTKRDVTRGVLSLGDIQYPVAIKNYIPPGLRILKNSTSNSPVYQLSTVQASQVIQAFDTQW